MGLPACVVGRWSQPFRVSAAGRCVRVASTCSCVKELRLWGWGEGPLGALAWPFEEALKGALEYFAVVYHHLVLTLSQVCQLGAAQACPPKGTRRPLPLKPDTFA